MNILTNQLKNLAYARKVLSEINDSISLLQHELEQTDAFKAIQKRATLKLSLTKEISELETLIRENGLQLSSATGYENRKPVIGVEVKAFLIVNIIDDISAKKWASENAPSMLSLSSKFGKLVEPLEVPFKEVKTEYRAQISSDLSAYLENENTQDSTEVST